MAEPSGTPAFAARSVVLSAVWRSRWLILAAAVLAGVGGYLLSASQPATYTAQSRIVLGENTAFAPLGSQSYVDPGRYVANQAAIIGTGPILERAAEEIGGGVTAGDIGSGLDVGVVAGNDVISVDTTADSAEDAAARANAVVAAYREYVRSRVSAETQAALRATQDAGTIAQIQARAALYGDGVELVEEAGPGSASTSRSPVRDAAILAVIGALVAAMLSVLRRSPMTEPSPLIDGSRARLLGTVPVQPVRRGRPRLPQPADYALTLVALEYARQDLPGPVLVTQASWESGAAAVAHGLAVSAAAQGRRVLVVDAEPASRELLMRSGATPPRHSLDELDTGSVSEDDVLVRLPQPGDHAPTAFVATFGAVGGPVNLDALRKALVKLTGRFDLVLIQAGPVSQDPLAFALVQQAGVVIGTVGAKDDAADLDALGDRLQSAQRSLIGVIVTRPARRTAGATLAPTVARSTSPAPRTGDAGPARSRPVTVTRR